MQIKDVSSALENCLVALICLLFVLLFISSEWNCSVSQPSD